MPIDWDAISRRMSQQATAQQGTGGGASSSGVAAPQPQVFFGSDTRMPLRPRSPSRAEQSMGIRPNMLEVEPDYPKKRVTTKKYKSLDDALGTFYSWSDEERRKWGEYLVEIGYLDPEDQDDYATLLKSWNEIVSEAANFSAAGRDVDPWAAARIIAGTDSGGKTMAGRERGFTGERSTVQKTVDLTDPTTAKAAVNQTLSRLLGRYANDEELAAFTATLNQAERDNPVETRTTTQYKDGDAVSSSSTSSGGVNGAQVLEDEAMAAPDFGAYQAATTYFNALMGAIQSPV